MPNRILQDERQLKDNLTRIVKEFNETLIDDEGKTRDLSTDLPPNFRKVLSDYATKFEREVGSLDHTDDNVRFLGAMGAMLLSWTIAYSRAKEGNTDRKYTIEFRRRAIDSVYWLSKEYLDLVLKEAFDVGARLNDGKNSPIMEASEGYHPTVNTLR